MAFHPKRTAIVGATGRHRPLPRPRVRQPGRAVRVVSRHREHLEEVFAGLPVEIATADALDQEALEECDLVVNAATSTPPRASSPS